MPVLLPPREAYRRWAPTWDDCPSPIVSLEAAWMAPRLGELGGKRVLDAGCGTGRWLTELLQSGAVVVGIDLSAAMLGRACRKPGVAGRVAVADLAALPVAPAWADLALCALALGHLPDPLAAFERLAAAVRPGGRRTFSAGGQTWEAASYLYAADALAARAAAAGLVPIETASLAFGEEQREIFRAAGKARMFEEVRGLPAVLAAHWRRP
jgi:malonyl-CoA O-methyltransferase